jgi:hypothetical protein
MVRSFELFGHQFVSWVPQEIADPAAEVTQNAQKAAVMAKSHD